MSKSEQARNLRATNPELSKADIGRKLGMSHSTVCQALAKSPEPAAHETEFSADVEKAGNAVWQKRYNVLLGKYNKAVEETSVVQALVAEALEAAPKSYTSAPAIHSRAAGRGSPQSAVLMFSDTHIGQTITPEQTLGFGGYNFPIFLAQLKHMEGSVLSIVENHQRVPTDELVVAMLGDMLHGALLHGAEAAQRNTLFTQFYAGGHAIAQFLRNVARAFPVVRIQTVVGNHPRWQNQHKMPTTNRYSNLDLFLYSFIQALTKDIKNIHWDLNQQPFSIFDVKGWVFHASHGDHLRGGDKMLGIPNHAFGRQTSTTTQLFVKHGQRCPNYYLTGHLHRGITLPHALGSILVNGGFPGLDGYALNENFNPVDPSQRFFFVHPKYGKTAEYELSLKFAKVTEKAPYDIPAGFPCE